MNPTFLSANVIDHAHGCSCCGGVQGMVSISSSRYPKAEASDLGSSRELSIWAWAHSGAAPLSMVRPSWTCQSLSCWFVATNTLGFCTSPLLSCCVFPVGIICWNFSLARQQGLWRRQEHWWLFRSQWRYPWTAPIPTSSVPGAVIPTSR
jgi:hypothetical protein